VASNIGNTTKPKKTGHQKHALLAEKRAKQVFLKTLLYPCYQTIDASEATDVKETSKPGYQGWIFKPAKLIKVSRVSLS
jgi:hypothetical protein